jgi:hypothetical protein
MDNNKFNQAKKVWVNYVRTINKEFRREARADEDMMDQLKANNELLDNKDSVCFGCPDFLVGLFDDIEWNINTDLTADDIDNAERLIIRSIFKDEYKGKLKKFDNFRELVDFKLPNGCKVITYHDPCTFVNLVAEDDWEKFKEYVMSIELQK